MGDRVEKPEGLDNIQGNKRHVIIGSTLEKILDYIKRSTPAPERQFFRVNNIEDGVHFQPNLKFKEDEDTVCPVVVGVRTTTVSSNCKQLEIQTKNITLTPVEFTWGNIKQTLAKVDFGATSDWVAIDSFAGCGGVGAGFTQMDPLNLLR